MHQDIDEFNKLMNKVESNSPNISNSPKNESTLDLADYGMDPVHEGILQKGINRVSNLLSANLKSKISDEWKHLDEDSRKLLLRVIAGDSSVFGDEEVNIDVALAQAFKDKVLSSTKTKDEGAGIVVNKDIDLSNSGATSFPDISIVEVKGDLKCNYASFNSFKNFPSSVKSLEFIKGKSQIENLEGIPTVNGKNDANYAIDLKYTKINSTKGWKSDSTIKGNVSFRGCDLKELSVEGTIYINGILDLRDNPNISIETLKAILLKDYSRNQIIVKGGIYHTLESDGYYNSSKLNKEEFVNEDLSGLLNEARGVNRAGVLVPQTELWKIGPEIIKQAEAKKKNKETKSAKTSLAEKIKPEIQNLVSDMASSQLDKNSVAQASKKIVSGMSSDEFRNLMKGLFDNLLKQLTEMMKSTGGGDSSKVDKSVETITNIAAENVADKIEEFSKNLETEIKSDNCLDTNKINEDLLTILKSVPEVGSSDIVILQKKAESLIKASESKDRELYSKFLKDFLNVLYVGILGKSEVSENTLTKILDNCFGETVEKKDTKEPKTPSKETPESPTAIPKESPKLEPIKGTKAPTEPPKPKEPSPLQKKAIASTKPKVIEPAPVAKEKPTVPKPTPSLLANATAKKTEIPSSITNAISNSKTSKGLNRFQNIIGSGSSPKGKSEEK